MPLYFLDSTGKLVAIGLGKAEIEFHESLSVVKNVYIRHELALMTGSALEPGKIYLEKKGDALQYTVIDSGSPTPKTGLITNDDIEKLSECLKDPFELDAIKPLLREILDVTAERGHTLALMVPTNKFYRGPLLVSTGFGPCNAVIARLKNTEYSVYHAASFSRDTLYFQKFVDSIKNDFIDVFVIQKSSNKKNLLKASLLAIELSDCLGVEVARLPVERYTCIILDSTNKKIILAHSFNELESPDEYKDEKIIGHEIDLTKAIPLKQSILDALAFKKAFPEVAFEIPEKFLTLVQEEKKEVSAPELSSAALEKKKELTVVLDEKAKLEQDLTNQLTKLSKDSKASVITKLKNKMFVPINAKTKVLQLCLEYLQKEKSDPMSLLAEIKKYKYSKSGTGSTAQLVKRTMKLLQDTYVLQNKI